MKILIAEDDPTSRRTLGAVLKKYSYDVIATCDGNEAWAELQKPDAPRLAILDWMMPGMDGLELCRRLRAQTTEGPRYLILLTSRDHTADIVTGLGAGANDYISKPFNPEELCARVDVGRRVLDLQEALAARVVELQGALNHVKTLQGILPICMFCHRIRNDLKSWERIEMYISEHTDAQFSHSLCPECYKSRYPELMDDDSEDKP